MNNDQIKIKEVRLSFPNLFVPKAVNPGDEPRYGASFLLDKEGDASQIDLIRKTIWGLAKDKFGAKAKDLLKSKKIKICLHEGVEKEYEGYDKSNMFVSTSAKIRPTVVDKDRSPLVADDGRPYAGCYVNAVVRFWVQDNQFGKRINAQLQGVQFVRDGEAFGAAPFNPEEHFEDETGGVDDDPPESRDKSAKYRAVEGAAEPPDEDEIPF